MKIFLDTASVDEIRECAESGLVDGVTTNPSLAAKEGVDYNDRLREICKVVSGPVSAQVLSSNWEEMVKEGQAYAKIAKNIVVKVPLTEEGLRACQALSKEGIKVNVTLCFSPTQALLAAKSGATFVSPFLGRLDDISEDSMKLIREIVQIYKIYGYKTEVLAASIRHPQHVVQSALEGAHIGTMPTKVFKMLFKHPLTDKGIQKFLEDYQKANPKFKIVK